MSLDATKPKGTNLISELDDYERETRAALNALEAIVASGAFPVFYTSITLTDPILEGNNYPVEVLALTASGAINLNRINLCQQGAIKILVFDDSHITIKHDEAKIILAGGEDLNPNSGDIVALINRDGDPTTSTNGYWREVFRKLF